MLSGMLTSTCLLAFIAADPPKMEPLTQDQKEQIQKLVQRTQEQASNLKSLLDSNQEELLRLYGEFNLDEEGVAKKQAKILDLQKQILANHHHLQVELRKIVGEERFKVLNQRIQRILYPPSEKK